MANALSTAALLNSEYSHNPAQSAYKPRNIFEKVMMDAERKRQLQEDWKVAQGKLPADIAYGEEGLQAPAVAGGLVSLDPTDYLSGAGLAKLAAMAKVGGAGISTLLGSRLLANKLGAGSVPSMFRQSGMFAGKGAKTANLEALAKAEELKAAGVPDSQIWKETGWTLDTPDKMPRFEIPDVSSDVKYTGKSAYEIWKDMSKQDNSVRNMAEFMDKYPSSPLTSEANKGATIRPAYDLIKVDDPALAKPINDIFSHEQLYSAYPESMQVKVAQKPTIEGMVGEGNASFTPDLNLIAYGKIGSPEKFKSTTLHELQHAIQQREGFARGGSPEYIKNNPMEFADANAIDYAKSLPAYSKQITPEDKQQFINDYVTMTLGHPNDVYGRLAGEAEARLTQSRMNLTPAERAAQYPYDPAYFEQATGVPLNSLIVRKEGGTAMSLPQDNAMTRLIREAQAQIDAENAAKNALKYKIQDNRVRNALVGIGAGGAGVAGGYYGADYLSK